MKKLLSTVALLGVCATVTPASAALLVGGFSLGQVASSLISSTGTFTTSGGTLDSVLTDNSVDTWAFSRSVPASVQLGFASSVLNGTGTDLVLFEVGLVDTLKVTINGITKSYLAASTGTTSVGGFEINAVSVDLLDFGIASGAVISNLVIGVDTPGNNNLTVPSLALVGEVERSTTTPVPEPASMALSGLALAGLALARRRRR